MLYLNKKLTSQLNNIFIDYFFDKNYEEHFKETIISFFSNKIQENLISHLECSFFMKFNSLSLSDLSSISLTLLDKFKEELLANFDTKSYSLVFSTKSFSEQELDCLKLMQYISLTETYKTSGITPFLSLFLYEEINTYIKLYSIKNSILNKDFFMDSTFVDFDSDIKSILNKREQLLEPILFEENVYNTFFYELKEKFHLDFLMDLGALKYQFYSGIRNQEDFFRFDLINLRTKELFYLDIKTSDNYRELITMIFNISSMNNQFFNTKELLLSAELNIKIGDTK